MKKNNFLKGMSAIAILSAAGVAAIAVGTNADIQTKALDANQFIHYKGLAATCEQDGVTDYYTNCYDATYTELPEGATVVEERQATAADVEYIAEHDEEDARLIHAEGHDFDGATGECVHVKTEKLTTEIFDLYENHGTKGTATLVETAETVPGFDKVYSYTHTYNNGVGWYIANAFKDYDITECKTISFYIDTNSKEFMFAGDDDLQATGYEIHPHESFGGCSGVITCVNKGSGTWEVSTEDFKFRNMGNGAAVSSFTFTGRDTMNELFHIPSNVNWGPSTIKISEIHVTKPEKCGARSMIANAIINPTKWTKIGESTKSTGSLYDTNGAHKYQTGDFSLEGLNQIKFRVKNDDTNNSFIIKGNTSTCTAGIYSGKDETVIATKEGTTWTVKMESGHKFFELPSWAEKPSYSVNNASKFSDLFYFDTYSTSGIKISDFVVKGEPTVKRYNVTNEALDLFENDPSKGTCRLIDLEESVVGFGKKYQYKSMYNDGVAKSKTKSWFSEYNLTGVKTVEFWISHTVPNVGGEVIWTSDDGTNNAAYSLHPAAGAQNPGIVRATQTEPGTWDVTGIGLTFRKKDDGKTYASFTYTNRTTLADLFGNKLGTVPSSVYIGDVIVTK